MCLANLERQVVNSNSRRAAICAPGLVNSQRIWPPMNDDCVPHNVLDGTIAVVGLEVAPVCPVKI